MSDFCLHTLHIIDVPNNIVRSTCADNIIGVLQTVQSTMIRPVYLFILFFNHSTSLFTLPYFSKYTLRNALYLVIQEKRCFFKQRFRICFVFYIERYSPVNFSNTFRRESKYKSLNSATVLKLVPQILLNFTSYKSLPLSLKLT